MVETGKWAVEGELGVRGRRQCGLRSGHFLFYPARHLPGLPMLLRGPPNQARQCETTPPPPIKQLTFLPLYVPGKDISVSHSHFTYHVKMSTFQPESSLFFLLLPLFIINMYAVFCLHISCTPEKGIRSF